ncbi:MAG: RNA polymerase sigma factor [Candidatus Limnocylindria bacterium]
MILAWRLAGGWWLFASRERGSAASIGRAGVIADLQHSEGQGLFGFVRRLGLTDEQADDAVQEVFARLLAELHRDVSVANPRSWAYRSIYRLAMDQYRLQRRLAALTDALGRHPTPSQGDVTDRIAVWGEVKLLPERQRHVIYLRYRSDLPFDEIGDVLGITSSAARSHATQAVATLRLRLTPEIEEMASN